MTAWRLSLALPFVLVLVVGLGHPAWAQDHATSPVGRWKTIDDSTKKPKSVVRVWEKSGVVYGTIESLFPDAGQPADPVCDKCEGASQGKPIKGMTIMWGFAKDDDEWTGGRILDPENGKVYKCYLEVVDGGRRLKVRGYVGISVIGRTQYCERSTDPPFDIPGRTSGDYLAMRTEQGAWRMTVSATLPRRNRRNPRRLWLPSATRS